MAVIKLSEARNLALKLHTDLQNLSEYAQNPDIQASIILVAEEKLAFIQAQLIELRNAIGMRGSPTILVA